MFMCVYSAGRAFGEWCVGLWCLITSVCVDVNFCLHPHILLQMCVSDAYVHKTTYFDQVCSKNSWQRLLVQYVYASVIPQFLI